MARCMGAIVVGVVMVLAGSCGSDEPGRPSSVELAVVGMHCTGCEDGIREHVGGLEGVEQVEADHVDGRVVVTYRPGDIDVPTVAAAIEELGFEAAPLPETDASEFATGEVQPS